MRSFKLGLAAATVICALATSAHADCVRVQTMGQGLTHGIAELFATKGLANTIYGQGRVGKGPVTTKCDDDVPLVADGVQSDVGETLPRRVAVLLIDG